MTREIGPELVARIRKFADSLEAIARGEVVLLYSTPQTHATPGEGSVPKSYRKPDAKRINFNTKREPVAWAILHKDHQYVSLLRETAEANNVYVDAEIVPLYRSPTLTAEEREAIKQAMNGYEAWMDDNSARDRPDVQRDFATLRALLERTK
ncbi:MAG: hypothetical protein EBR82_54875 [Caulobacteraceae bacterium]|nr:hypothetical protein [Caulobacteraceae bacterium]